MTITTVGYDMNPRTLLGGIFIHSHHVLYLSYNNNNNNTTLCQKHFVLFHRKNHRRLLRSLWGVHPHLANPHRGEQANSLETLQLVVVNIIYC